MGLRRGMNEDLREFRRLERICTREAASATMDLERVGLLKVAEDCRRAAAELEAQQLARAHRFRFGSGERPGSTGTL